MSGHFVRRVLAVVAMVVGIGAAGSSLSAGAAPVATNAPSSVVTTAGNPVVALTADWQW